MAGGELVEFYLSVDAATGTSQPDPNDSLGNNRSGTKIEDFQSTVTTAQVTGPPSTRHLLIDSSRIGDGDDVHRLKWIVIVTGPASLQFARVTSFDSATGTYTLDRPTTQNAAIGDYYRLFSKHGLFDVVTAQQSADGMVDYRIIFMRNVTTVTASATQFYVVYSDIGPAQVDIIPATAVNDPVLLLASETTSPVDDSGYVDPQTRFSGSPKFSRPFMSGAAIPVPGITVTNTQDLAIIVKRTIRVNSERRRSAAMMIVCVTTTSGQDPDPLTSAMLIPFDVAGYTPVAAIERDRYAYIRGGARVTGTLTAQETTLPVFDRDVIWSVSPLGSLVLEDTYPRTDADGESVVTFLSSTDPGDEGSTSDITFSIGNGEET